MKDALKYFESALKSVDSKGLPANQGEVRRMFQSGQMRYEKVHLAWGEVVRMDLDFPKKWPTRAKDKQKLDSQWTAYKRVLR